MKRTFLLFLCGLVFISPAISQSRSFGTLPLARVPGSSGPPGAKMDESPKYQQALKVYETLVAARGDFRYPVPTLVMRKQERQVASMDYENLEITLEDKAFDVCASFGPNTDAALAFLLGHELTHYYEKHAWRRGFASEYRDLPIGIALDSLADDAAHETEADYLGGFLAYSAGYGLFDQGPAVIKKLYEAYRLSEKLDGYPSLKDRQALTQRSAEKLQRLVEVFDMANLLTAIGKYEEAYEYYRYVLMEYQSREIYNNLGVTAVLDAMQYFKEGELKFRYPLELDLQSSATKGSGMVDTRTKILRQALLHFDAAISLDPNYAPAYLNKACAYALLGDPIRARYFAEFEALSAAQKNNYPKTAADIQILRGILAANAGDTEAAKQIFSQAAQNDNALAALNLKILNNQPLDRESPGMGGLPRTERIDGQALALVADEAVFDTRYDITLKPHLLFHQNPKQGDNSRLFISQNDQTTVTTFFHLTGPGYTGETARKIRLGASRTDIIAAYKEPKTTLETPQGQIMVYGKIIFILDASGKLTRWINYQ